ncbi:MAG: signal peptidase I, partial [Thaumarchaeota archaeon]|nr:signal peptidase I [Nitrososphaerota archaeon]
MRPPTVNRRTIKIGIALAVFSTIALLPILSGTKSYPVAIVQGNSMYPNLQNGDIVTFRAAPNTAIPNGTIIIFVESDTGISLLDSLTKPVVIHRIVGTTVQGDGTVLYRTKGDNNQFPDAGLVQSDHILGTPTGVIPKAGAALLFLGSPQGLVAAIGFVTLFYLGNIEAKESDDKRREEFLGAVAM